MTPQQPTIGRIVIYRSRTGDYDVPAIVSATRETLLPEGVERGHVPPISAPDNVHLTVFTPGAAGKRREATDLVPSAAEELEGFERSENTSGCYQEWDVPYNGTDAPRAADAGLASQAGAEVVPAITPGSWRWPLV